MLNLLVLSSLLIVTAAFTPAARVHLKSRSLKMSNAAFDPRAEAGSSLPFTFFDPLGLAPSNANDFKKYREAELKHGRVAMLAVLGVLAGESGLTFFGDDINGPAIYQYQEAESLFNAWSLNVVGLILAIEGYNIVNGWQSPGQYEGPIAGLKAGYENGNLGFDPLELKPTNPAYLKSIKTKELNNGRLAMIAITGIVVQELITGEKVF